MTRTRLVALPGAALFVVGCALVRGGLFDNRHFGDVTLYGGYAQQMAHGHLPYRDFFDEYPPLAQPLFLAVHVLPGTFTPAFRWTMTLCGAAALVLLVEAMVLLRAPLVRVAAAGLVAGLSPLLVGSVFLNTYDLFPAVLTIAAMVALLHGRDRTAYVLLALAIAAKVYPVVVVPVVLFEAWRHGGRDAVRRALRWLVGVVVLVHLPFVIAGPGGLRFSYWVQIRRGLEVESLGGALLLVLDRLGLYHVTLKDEAPGSRDLVGMLPDLVAVLSTLVVVAAVVLACWLYLRGRRDPVLLAAAAVTAFAAFGKVLSPQYVDWLVPLVPAAGLVAAGTLAAVLVLTQLEYNRFLLPHGTVRHWGEVLTWWIVARDVVLVGLLVLLLVKLRAGARSRSAP